MLTIQDDPMVMEKLGRALSWAFHIGKVHGTGGLVSNLEWLSHYGGKGDDGFEKTECVITNDFAPHSFLFNIIDRENRTSWIHGGLIYQGPESPADGGAPSFTVSLNSGTGWFCHT